MISIERNNRLRGNAALGVIAMMVGVGFVWWFFMKLTGCIYDNKEARAAKFTEVMLTKGKMVKQEEPEREAGGYTVRCYPIDGHSCKEIYLTPTPMPSNPTPTVKQQRQEKVHSKSRKKKALEAPVQ